MGGGSFPKIPDYRSYKVVDAPELVELERKLAHHGLKDPWIRNEVWRYTMVGAKGTTLAGRMGRSIFKGFPVAVGVTAVLICAEKIYHTMYPPPHHDDHH